MMKTYYRTEEEKCENIDEKINNKKNEDKNKEYESYIFSFNN